MRAVLTRVSEASVSVDGATVGSISCPETCGILALVGVSRDDVADAATTEAAVAKMVDKIANLRILPEETSALEVGAPVLVVSQFTLYGRTAKGRRPSWSDAAPGEAAEPVIEDIVGRLRALGLHVETGSFGAMMRVHSVNEGPFTVLVET